MGGVYWCTNGFDDAFPKRAPRLLVDRPQTFFNVPKRYLFNFRSSSPSELLRNPSLLPFSLSLDYSSLIFLFVGFCFVIHWHKFSAIMPIMQVLFYTILSIFQQTFPHVHLKCKSPLFLIYIILFTPPLLILDKFFIQFSTTVQNFLFSIYKLFIILTFIILQFFIFIS